MLTGGGGILVEPAALEEMAAKFARVAASTGSLRGSMSGAASAADNCAGAAAGAYARLESLLGAALSGLDVCSASLSWATSSAATAYVATDGAQFPLVAPGPGGPAVP
jgi:hypothetical protein